MYRLTMNIDIVLNSCGITLNMIGSATRYQFQDINRKCNLHWCPVESLCYCPASGHVSHRVIYGRQYVYNQLIKLRDILSIKMPCQISVLLQLEMT